MLDALQSLIDRIRRGPPSGPVPEIPSTATFRRAVGLELRLRPCGDLSRVMVTAARHGGETRTLLSVEEAALVCSMGTWMTSEELGVRHGKLARMVADNLLFWSEGRPSQVLSQGSLSSRTGPLGLRRNVWATPIMQRADKVEPVPFMPRTAELDGAELHGMHFGVMEMGKQVLGVGLSCCRRHALELMDLVAALDGTGPQASLKTPLFDVLCELGLVESFGLRVTSSAEPAVTWLGHAAVLVELGGTRVLVDPLFHPASIPHRENETLPPDPRTIGPVDAVLITHGDNDHFNPQALARIRRDTRIVIPRVDGNPPYQVDMRGMLAMLGFDNVTEVEAWEQLQIGAISVVAAPFAGEDWGLRLANRTYVLEGGGRCVYLNADSAPMPDVVERIASRHRVDLALVGVGGCEEARVMPPGFGYGNFYAPFMEKAARNEWLQLCSNPDDAAATVEKLGAKRAFGYAAGGAEFIAVAHSDRGTHAQLGDALARRGMGDRAVALPLGRAFPLT